MFALVLGACAPSGTGSVSVPVQPWYCYEARDDYCPLQPRELGVPLYTDPLARDVDPEAGLRRSGLSSAIPVEAPDDVVELLQVLVADGEAAACLAMLDGDLEPQDPTQIMLQRPGIGILGGRRRRLGLAGRAARASVWRTERPRVMTRSARAMGSAAASKARAWPALSMPSCSRSWTAAGSFSSRKVFAIWARLLPTCWARSSWLRENSSISRR